MGDQEWLAERLAGHQTRMHAALAPPTGSCLAPVWKMSETVSRLRTNGAGNGVRKPLRISLERPPLGEG